MKLMVDSSEYGFLLHKMSFEKGFYELFNICRGLHDYATTDYFTLQ